ncbi:hypothetical protein YC2023_053757 [Brassica napus]
MSVYGLGGLRVGDSNLRSSSRTTAPPVCGLSSCCRCGNFKRASCSVVAFLAVGFPVASRFEPPFSLEARGNRGLVPLFPFPWGHQRFAISSSHLGPQVVDFESICSLGALFNLHFCIPLLVLFVVP